MWFCLVIAVFARFCHVCIVRDPLVALSFLFVVRSLAPFVCCLLAFLRLVSSRRFCFVVLLLTLLDELCAPRSFVVLAVSVSVWFCRAIVGRVEMCARAFVLVRGR